MSELYLVRHGQASFGSSDYDQLSEIGFKQSNVFGEFFVSRNIIFDRSFAVICGVTGKQYRRSVRVCNYLNIT